MNLTPEHRARIAASHAGKPLSDAHKEAVRISCNKPEYIAALKERLTGREVASETCEKLGDLLESYKSTDKYHENLCAGQQARRAREKAERLAAMTPEERAALDAPKVRKPVSDEARKKMSDARIGKPRPQSVKDAVSRGLMGHPVSDESRERMRQSALAAHARKRAEQASVLASQAT